MIFSRIPACRERGRRIEKGGYFMMITQYIRFVILSSLLGELSVVTGDVLSDISEFEFLKSLESRHCHGEEEFFLILVHSKPSHFREREIIRDTWGSVREIEGKKIQVGFLMGLPEEDFYKRNALSSPRDNLSDRGTKKSRLLFSLIRENIEKEERIFGDIIQGNFLDTNRNLTYKHLMGHRWLSENCSPNKPIFLLKTDDDVFVEIFHLFKFITALYGNRPKRSLICDVIPRGTAPRKVGKWAVKSREYKKEMYPEYCNGMAYLMTPDLAPEFLAASSQVSKFWIDDVYVMGLLREKLGIKPFYLNLRYAYDEKGYRKWLKSKRHLPLPFLFVSIDTTRSDWTNTVKQLWFKTLNIHAASLSSISSLSTSSATIS